jgi:hypothetical protein
VARKYYGIIDDINGNTYTVELWDAPSGSLTGGTQLPLAADGFILDQQGEGDALYENPIRKTKVTAYFVVNSTADHTFFKNIGVDDENKYALVIWKGSNLFWVGRVLSDLNQYELRPELNTTYTVNGVDCLALMDQYYVDPDWFSSADRLNILDLIRNSLSFTELDLYWDHLGKSTEYIIDSVNSATPRTQQLKVLEININAAITDYRLYYTQKTPDNTWKGWIDCEEIIQRCLLAYRARILFDNGKYYIYQPTGFDSAATIYYSLYGTDGTLTSNGSYPHQTGVSTTLSARPQFQSFPIVTHQPSIKNFIFKWVRKAFARRVRTFGNQSTSNLTVGPINASQGPRVYVYANLNWAIQFYTGFQIPASSHIWILFRVYTYNSGTGAYKKYDYNNQTWVNTTGVPDWEQIEVKVASTTQTSSTTAIQSADFMRDFSSSTGVDNIYCDFGVLGSVRTALSNVSSGPISLWGNANLFQEEDLPKSITTSNTDNVTASKNVEIEAYFYDSPFGLYDTGLLYNSSTGSIQVNTATNMGLDWMSVYKFSPKILQGTFHDAGTYNRVKTINYNTEIYTWQGGKFYAQSCRYEGEWMKVFVDTNNIFTGGELDSDEIDFNSQGDEALRRLTQQTEDLRESIGNVYDGLPYHIGEISPGAPTTDPLIDTDFDVKVYFDQSDSLLKWDLQELGKVTTITSATYTVSGYTELYLCDTTAHGIAVTLPSAADYKGRRYIFKKTKATHSVAIQATLIDDGTEIQMNNKNEAITVMSDGAQWWVIAKFP